MATPPQVGDVWTDENGRFWAWNGHPTCWIPFDLNGPPGPPANATLYYRIFGVGSSSGGIVGITNAGGYGSGGGGGPGLSIGGTGSSSYTATSMGQTTFPNQRPSYRWRALPDDTMEQPPLKNTGIEVGEIIGYRIWRIWRIVAGHKGTILTSYSQSNSWLPDIPMKGNVTDHGVEGVWAFKDAYRCGMKMGSGRLVNYAWGSVYLWGDIVEHEIGYRASFAKVRSIDGCYAPDESCNAEMLDKLRKVYKIDGFEK